jgi:hypothetical protein
MVLGKFDAVHGPFCFFGNTNTCGRERPLDHGPKPEKLQAHVKRTILDFYLQSSRQNLRLFALENSNVGKALGGLPNLCVIFVMV